jgi:tRNA-2-methylthio-N6-dimethylallyladenosine synthase
VVTTTVTHAAPHYLIADGAPLSVRRTRGGDAWQARQDGTGQDGIGQAAGPPAAVHLGMPAVGAPAP